MSHLLSYIIKTGSSEARQEHFPTGKPPGFWFLCLCHKESYFIFLTNEDACKCRLACRKIKQGQRRLDDRCECIY